MIDQEFVQYIVNAIVSKPDKVRVERVVDERGVLLTLHVDEEDLGRVIGRKGVLAQSLRVLLRALGSKNEAHYNLRIADGKEGDAERDAYSGLRREESAAPADSSEVVSEEVAVEDSNEDSSEDSVEDDSLLDKTKKELDQFDDLDI